MIEINWNPDRKELRQFAVALLMATVLAGGLLWWRLGPNKASQLLWVVGPLLAAIGLLVPRLLKPVFIGLSLLAFPIGYAVGFAALALVYYLIVTPIGFVFRAMKRDPLHRRLDDNAETYWVPRDPSLPAKRYFQQF